MFEGYIDFARENPRSFVWIVFILPVLGECILLFAVAESIGADSITYGLAMPIFMAWVFFSFWLLNLGKTYLNLKVFDSGKMFPSMNPNTSQSHSQFNAAIENLTKLSWWQFMAENYYSRGDFYN